MKTAEDWAAQIGTKITKQDGYPLMPGGRTDVTPVGWSELLDIKRTTQTKMKIIGYFVSTIIIATYSKLMSGWAITKLWAWFMVTTFGLPHLTIPAAIGLALMVGYFQTLPKSDEKSWKTLRNGVIIGTLKPLFYVGMGAIIKAWLRSLT